MKILGKVKPDYDTCCGCLDEQADGIKQAMACCSECLSRIPYSEIIKIDHTLFKGDYAIVINDGKFEKVDLDRIFDVHTEHNAMDGFQRGFRAMTKAMDDYTKHQIFEEFKED